MEGGVRLCGRQRERLLGYYRRHHDPQVRLRAQVILLLADGHTWALITAVLFCSSKTVALWQRRFLEGGAEALLGQTPGPHPALSLRWAAVAAGWVRHRWPRDFGLRRSRWCCRAVVVLLVELHRVEVSEESVRRWLHAAGLVWRRPRPVLRPRDPQREEKIAAIRGILEGLPADEVAVFQDEVDLNTNPKIGSAWMPRGEQALVETPGTNTKRHLAGSLNWRSGGVVRTLGREGQGRNADLFLEHLDDLRRHYRRYKMIHVICDNAGPHTGRRARAYAAAHARRVRLHYLPRYAPETNPIERVWWRLHEAVTRNHRCRDMDSLLAEVTAWLDESAPCRVEDQVYFPHAAAA